MWEPVKPSLAVATEAYQVLLELARQHPEDKDLARQRDEAHFLMCAVWREQHGLSMEASAA